MREHQQVAGHDPVADLQFPDLGLLLVGEQDHHDVASVGGLGHVDHLETRILGLRAARGVGTQADDDVDAGLLQVERVRVPLRAVAEDRDRLPLEEGEVGVVVVVDAFAGTVHEDGQRSSGRAWILLVCEPAVPRTGSGGIAGLVACAAIAAPATAPAYVPPPAGVLTQLSGTSGCVLEPASDGCAGGFSLNGAAAVAVSPDGSSVYSGSLSGSGSIAVFDRSPGNGALTQKPAPAGCLNANGDGGCARR